MGRDGYLRVRAGLARFMYGRRGTGAFVFSKDWMLIGKTLFGWGIMKLVKNVMFLVCDKVEGSDYVLRGY